MPAYKGNLVADILDNVESGTVSIACPRILDDRIVAGIKGLLGRGCKVRVAARFSTKDGNGASNVDPSLTAALRVSPLGHAFDQRPGMNMHAKFIHINGRYAGDKERLVFHGTPNLTNSAMTRQWECVVKEKRNLVADPFGAFFDRIATVTCNELPRIPIGGAR